MTEIFAQGDLLIERVPDVAPSGTLAETRRRCASVLLEGEATGHCHAIRERVRLFRDDDLARDIPAGLYVGHLLIASAYARVTHEEHAPLTLPRGTYRVRRQRELARGMRGSCRLSRRSLRSRRRRLVIIVRGGEPYDARLHLPIAIPQSRACGLPIRPQGWSLRPASSGCDGPLALVGLAVRMSRDDGRNVRFRLVDRLRRRIASRVEARIDRKVLAAVDSAVNPADALVRRGGPRRWCGACRSRIGPCGPAAPNRPVRSPACLQALAAPRGFSSCAAGRTICRGLAPTTISARSLVCTLRLSRCAA